MSANAIAPVANPIPPGRTSGSPLAFMPKDFDDAWRQASVLAQVSIFPDYLKGKPHEILCTIITGAELGLSPMQSVRDIVVVKGKGFIQSKLKVALIQQALNRPAKEYFRMVSSDASKAVYETMRDGQVTRYEYTMEMAKLAELGANDNYRKRPAEMLRARCSGDLAEIVWPDVTRGIGNKEDLPDYGAVSVNAPPATFAPPPPEKPEEAQVVPPTPPRQPTPEQAFQQAKNEQDLKGIPPAEKKRAICEDKSSDSLAEAMNQGIDAHQQRLDRQPGDDDGDETPVQIPVSGMKPTADSDSEAKQVLSEVNGVDANLAGAAEQLDLISPRAKAVSGPMRQQIADAVKAKREAIKKARSGK